MKISKPVHISFICDTTSVVAFLRCNVASSFLAPNTRGSGFVASCELLSANALASAIIW